MPTPAACKYKALESKFRFLDWKKTQADELIHRLKVDNQIRFDLTQEARDMEEKTRVINVSLAAENKKMAAKLAAKKVDQSAQVEILTLENVTEGVLDKTLEPASRMKFARITGAQLFLEPSTLPGKQAM